jgi:ribonuclease P protein component
VKGTLKSRRQFLQVYEQGKKAIGRHVVAFALSRPPADSPLAYGPTVGYVASRKVGDSVRRNRAKRVLRAGLRPLYREVSPDLWIVLVARASLANPKVRSHEVTRELESLFQRMGLFRTPPASRHA